MTNAEPAMAAAPQDQGVARLSRSAIPLTGLSFSAFVFLLIGLAMVIDRASADPGATAVGAIGMAAGCLMAGLALTSYAELTPAGLAYRHDFRRSKVIPWACIESLHIGPGAGISLLSALWVNMREGKPVLVASIAGTRRYVARMITEIEAYRRHVPLTVVRDQRLPCRFTETAPGDRPHARGNCLGKLLPELVLSSTSVNMVTENLALAVARRR